jgi:hypothetical protein
MALRLTGRATRNVFARRVAAVVAESTIRFFFLQRLYDFIYVSVYLASELVVDTVYKVIIRQTDCYTQFTIMSDG